MSLPRSWLWKWNLGQQVAQGDAQEGAGGEGQNVAHRGRGAAGVEQSHAEEARQRHQGAEQGEAGIGRPQGAPAVPAGLHHAHDGVGVQRLVQQNGEEHPHPRQHLPALLGGPEPHGRAQGDSLGDGVHPQAEADAQKAPWRHDRTTIAVAVAVAVVVAGLGAEVVLVELEDAQQEDHEDQAPPWSIPRPCSRRRGPGCAPGCGAGDGRWRCRG